MAIIVRECCGDCPEALVGTGPLAHGRPATGPLSQPGPAQPVGLAAVGAPAGGGALSMVPAGPDESEAFMLAAFAGSGVVPRIQPGGAPFNWGYWSASLQYALESGLPTRMQALANCWRPGGVLTVRNNSDLYVPQWATLEWPDVVVVLLRGTSNYRQMASYILGGAYAPYVPYLGRVNSFFQLSSSQLASEIDAAIGPGGKPLFLSGHSYGGGCVPLVARALTGGRNPLWGAVTFGAPRVASSAFLSGIGTNGARFVNSGDPVAAVPPSTGQLGLITGLLSPLVAQAQPWATWGTGMGLDRSGGLFALDGAPLSVSSIIEFLVGLQTGGPLNFGQHSAESYVRNFQANSALNGRLWSLGFANGPAIRTINNL